MARRHGLEVYRGNGQKRTDNPQSWEDFTQEVERAAARARSGNRNAPGRTENLTLGVFHHPPDDRRCQFVMKSGKRCGSWAMGQGGRCRMHGGYRLNPAHPATLRLYRRGIIDQTTAVKEARDTLDREHSDREGLDARRAVKDELRARRIRRDPAAVLEGVRAYRENDAGRAWRRWLRLMDDRVMTSQARQERGRSHQETKQDRGKRRVDHAAGD